MISNNAKMTSNNNNIDEFGRDLSLKIQKPVQVETPILTQEEENAKAASNFTSYLARFKGMSWADISDMIEEEEEDERKKVETEELRKVLAERKELLQKGLYDLEEGEELEI
jgi:hypothetical protein